MEIETFENTEVAEMAIENKTEYEKFVDDLGLKGQKNLTSESKDICPYRKMNDDEVFTYTTLFPKVTPLENFEEEVIPIRILQLASHFKSLNITDRTIHIMSPERKEPDPVVIACQYNWRIGTGDYILGRWGDCLESFPILQEKAKKRAKETIEGFLESFKIQDSYKISEILAKIRE